MRLLFDRYAASMFRAVRAENEILGIAVPARDGIIGRIHREWMEGAWIYNNATRTKGPKLSISPWVSSQAMTAVFRAVGPGARELPDFWNALEAPFAKDLLIEVDGKKFGWLSAIPISRKRSRRFGRLRRLPRRWGDAIWSKTTAVGT